MARRTTAATIGVDVGTSATKGVLVAEDGRLLASASAGYPLLTPRPGWTEQHPEDWWRAAAEVLRRLTASAPDAEVAGVGLSGQMHGSVFLDGAGEVLRPALLWNDARTGAECAEIERRLGGRERVVAITGNRASAGFQAPKILWLRANEPDAYARVARVLPPKDHVRLRLTGEVATDAADASGTLLLDLATRRYSQEMLDALEVPRAWLPDVFEGVEVTSRVTAGAAALTGLPAGVPVVAGGGDNACAAVGAGILGQGQGAVSLGTSGVVFLRSDRPVTDPQGALNAFCDAAGGWHLMGVVLSAGGALRWFADAVAGAEAEILRRAGVDPFAALVDQALALPPGADGLLFLPYLAGERSPHMDPQARGAWVGLSLAHDRRHMLRAVVEGVGYALADCLERMRGLGLEPARLALVGGGARNPAWRRLLATQLRAGLAAPSSEEGPALGAAILARVGAGMDADLASAAARVVPGGTQPVDPDRELEGVYRALHARYGALYPALKAAGAFA
jgi:xylulokinase